MSSMATLRKAEVAEAISARRAAMSAERSPEAEALRDALAAAYVRVDGSNTSYIRALTGLTDEQLRSARAI